MIDGHIPKTDSRAPQTAFHAFAWLCRQTVFVSLPAVASLLAVSSLNAQIPEDPLTWIPAEESLTEQQDDHVEALALFAHGRVLLQRGLELDGAERDEQFAAALRRFQRAWWFEHDLISILGDIAPLLFELDRQFEANRYLIIAAEQQEIPTELLERIAAQLADLDDFDQQRSERALRLYLKLKQIQGNAVSTLTQFQIGRLSLTIGQYAQAAEAFAAVQRALEQKDNTHIVARLRDQLLRRPDATYALFGESYLRAGKLAEAEAAFRQADKSKPNPATLAYRLALVAKERGDTHKALELLQQYFDAKAKSAGLAPYAMLTELLDGPLPKDRQHPSTTDDKPTARPRRKPSRKLVDKVQQLVEADPSNTLLAYFAADVLRRAGKWDAAETLYRKLIEQDPAADGYQGLIAIYVHQKRWEPLLKQLAEFVAKTGSIDALDAIAEQIAQNAQMLDQLTKQAKTMAARGGNSVPDGAWLALALLHAKGKHDGVEIVKLFDRGLVSPPASAGQAAVNLAFAVLQSDQPEVAAKIFQRVLDDKLLPERRAEVNYYLAAAWAIAKDYERALAAAREAGRLDPNSPRMLMREPWILYQAKRLSDARALYIQLLDRFDGDHTTLENREAMRDIRIALSAVEVERKNLAAAEAWLQEALDEFPQDIGAFNDLGYLWADQGKHLQRALRMVQKAVEAEPDNIAYLDSLGWALYRLGRFTEALEPLEKAATSGDDVDGVILDHLGDAYVQAKQPAKAIEAWRKAAAAFREQDDSDHLKAIEKKLEQHAP